MEKLIRYVAAIATNPEPPATGRILEARTPRRMSSAGRHQGPCPEMPANYAIWSEGERGR
jgi:hypothetical protein